MLPDPAPAIHPFDQAFGTLQWLDLRTLWPHEEHSFTPWLERNLSILGNLIGMELELIARESAVGPFWLDLLLKDVGTDRIVVVENQIEPTDHDHLGKLLTYAAGNQASVAVWIASAFRDEHRQALDWLNGQTGQETEFFGVVLEALQIDNSKPAPHLRLVSFPNDFRKRAVEQRAQPTARGEAFRAFFQDLIDQLRTQYHFTQASKGQPQNWYQFASGHSGLNYAFVFGAENRVRVELYIDRQNGDWNKALFDTLAQQRLAIETELGMPLDWAKLDDKRASRIAIGHAGSITNDQATLDEIMRWAIEWLLKFKQAFGPRMPAAIERANTLTASSVYDPVEDPSLQ